MGLPSNLLASEQATRLMHMQALMTDPQLADFWHCSMACQQCHKCFCNTVNGICSATAGSLQRAGWATVSEALLTLKALQLLCRAKRSLLSATSLVLLSCSQAARHTGPGPAASAAVQLG